MENVQFFTQAGEGEVLGLQELEQSETDRNEEESRCPGAQPLQPKPPRLRLDQSDRKETPQGLETVSSVQILQ